MSRVIIKNHKLCRKSNHRLMLDIDGAPCACGSSGQCGDLVDVMKATVGGRYVLDWRIDTDIEGFGVRTEVVRAQIFIPEFEITLHKNAANGFYESNIACDIPVGGYADRRLSGVGSPSYASMNLERVQAMTASYRVLDPQDPESECILNSVTMHLRGRGEYENDPGVGNADLFVYAEYASLQSSFIGDHPIFGKSAAPDFDGRYSISRIVGFIGGGTALQGWCTDPSTYSGTSDQGDATFVVQNGCEPFGVEIEAHAGALICDGYPYVRADRCDGTGLPITVDVRDALEAEVSLPELDGVLYRPTGVRRDPPVDTDLWVPRLCDDSFMYTVYKNCVDDSDEILVDESSRPMTAITALVGTDRFYRDGEMREGDPIAVVWSDDPCDPLDSTVWERCGSAYLNTVPQRVRSDTPFVQDADYMYSYFVFPLPTIDHPNCEVVYRIGYRRIEDDDGTYPQVGGVPNAGPCASMLDTGQLRFCGDLDDAGDPQDPNVPAITDDDSPPDRPVSRLPRADLSGHDPSAEARAASQGGCCGPPLI